MPIRLVTLSLLLVTVGCASGPETEPVSPAQAESGGEAHERVAPGTSTADAQTPPQFACRLAPDFNRCIVDRLEGRAATEQELILLIQSYRMLGEADRARSHIAQYVETYPESPQALAYRDYLEQN